MITPIDRTCPCDNCTKVECEIRDMGIIGKCKSQTPTPASVEQIKCRGIEIEPGVFGGCDTKGGTLKDCPVCKGTGFEPGPDYLSPALIESDYTAVPEMRGDKQIGVTFERKDAPVGGGQDVPLQKCPKCNNEDLPLQKCYKCGYEWYYPRPPTKVDLTPTAQDIIAVLEDGTITEGIVDQLDTGAWDESVCLQVYRSINAFRAAVIQKIKEAK